MATHNGSVASQRSSPPRTYPAKRPELVLGQWNKQPRSGRPLASARVLYDADRFFANQVNGLVGAGDPNGVYLNLGRRSGGSHVRIALLTAQPADPGEQWEDVVEVSLVIPSGREVRWMSWAGETSGQLEVPAGSYRLRVSARGRDRGAADEFADVVVDHYLLELWPASQQEDAILRVGTDDARYWHAGWGGRR